MSLELKRNDLFARIRELDSVIVAFSGGVDSTLVLKVASDVLGSKALALTAKSPSMPKRELEEAVALANSMGVRHEIVETKELLSEDYAKNPTNRCYYCKKELFDTARAFRDRIGGVVIDGVNADDLSDVRPGILASQERGVLHPLAESNLTKVDVRELSKQLGLATWNKPQMACLASRIPYGTRVTDERLQRIERLETALRTLDFFDVRARLVPSNDDFVRIEVGEREIDRLISQRGAVVSAAKQAGFSRITLDLEGFRSGSMNDGLRILHQA